MSVMSKIVEYFEKKARFQDESEAELIREKLERLVNNILALVEKQDKRFQSTLVESGSVYEGVKVRQPDEFDFMIRINSLTNKPSFYPSNKGDGYVKLVLDEQGWEEFKDEEGFFNPNLLSRHFQKLVNESLSDTEMPEGLVIQTASQERFDETWWPVFKSAELLGNSGGQENPSGVMCSEAHGPATTLKIMWQGLGGDSLYRYLIASVDLTLTLDYPKSKLPVQLATELPPQIDGILEKYGFHVVPAGFDSWRISFSVVEKEVLSSSPDGFKACYRVLKVMRDDILKELGWDSSLVPSYMLKTVLLSQLFITDHTWQKDFCSQRIIHILELVLQGVKRGEIQSFFISRYNLLSVSDHENKLRQCVVEEMLNRMNGSLAMAHTMEEVREIRKQIRVLELIDVLDYIIQSIIAGKNLTAVWNKMFVNIGNVPTGWFWHVTEFITTELNEDSYKKLAQIWSSLEHLFKQLPAILQGDLSMLVQTFYYRTSEKIKKFELKHQVLSVHEVEQIPFQVAFEWLEGLVDYSTLPNLHKAVSLEFSPSGRFRDVVDVTMKEGSGRGLDLLKQRLKLFMIPFMTGMPTKEVLKPKLDYTTIHELDVD
ncbi:hypothetical protein OS493_010598 [Desmophyllum pertusum]|uniref:Mab-21-like nucleotidyltransferase domain-containing protein n=1 Tax=Desmophyllum pertusum TaxID=174260 RepID=A0A9X0D453_9CNID|nr:hypothetical protein OS493_010598 [Desmophyllum pertusum]